ncbi:hypothetical protein MUP46_04390 [Patescibacteria group bacterium]|nr:hypothetical protein [Patescibacteria group bacterium]
MANMSPEYPFNKEWLRWLLADVSVDHDNTINDTKGIVTETFNKEFGTSHMAIEISRWHSVADWAKELGASDKEAFAINQRYWYDSDLINQGKPKPGAIEFLQKANRGRLIINSSRPYDELDGTRKWYRQYAAFVKPEQIVVGLPDIVEAGDILSQALSKVWVAKLYKSRSHIEDVPFHAKMMMDYTDIFVFLLSDDTSLDGHYGTRLMRMGGIDGNQPDLVLLNKLLSV